jgi:hypothetical protein
MVAAFFFSLEAEVSLSVVLEHEGDEYSKKNIKL